MKPVLDAARRMNDPDILRQVHTRFIVTRVRMCIQTEGDHFGRLLNRIVKLISFHPPRKIIMCVQIILSLRYP